MTLLLKQINDYEVLYKDDRIITDSSSERFWEAEQLSSEFSGKVLLCGLGLGITASIMEINDNIIQIDVVEIDQEIIAIVPEFTDKVKIINADIFEHEGEYDYAYIDIWNDYQDVDKSKIKITAKEIVYFGQPRWEGHWA